MVDSASNRNEYQESSWEQKETGAQGWQSCCSLWAEYLKLLESQPLATLRASTACTGIALSLLLLFLLRTWNVMRNAKFQIISNNPRLLGFHDRCTIQLPNKSIHTYIRLCSSFHLSRLCFYRTINCSTQRPTKLCAIHPSKMKLICLIARIILIKKCVLSPYIMLKVNDEAASVRN
jgi:hypothetical protein